STPCRSTPRSARASRPRPRSPSSSTARCSPSSGRSTCPDGDPPLPLAGGDDVGQADAMSHLSRAVEETAEAAAEQTAELAEAIARRGWGVATAESLTGGTIATVLAAAPQAGTWLRGSVVAYAAEVKFGLLGVPRGPVVTEECA